MRAGEALLASREGLVALGFLAGDPDLGLDISVGPFQFLTPEVAEAAQVFPPDRARMDMAPSTLMRPLILDRVESEWNNY